MISISNAQRKPMPFSNFVKTIYHGIPLNLLKLKEEKGKYLAFIGENGELASLPIALSENQAYTYDAKIQAAQIAKELGEIGFADKMEKEAAALKKMFNKLYWPKEKSTFVIALRPCNIKSSNAGQCLFSKIADPEKAAATMKTLLSKEMFSGWGIRTISSDEKNYNPMSYHNGSIWPNDNALIAFGMHRYGNKSGVN